MQMALTLLTRRLIVTELTIPRYAPVWRTNLEFNGKSDYVEIPNSQDINFGKQDFTVACWVLAAKEQQDTKSDQNDILSKFLEETKGYPYAIRYLNQTADDNAGKILAKRFDGTLDSSVMSKTKINDGQFHHIAFVRKTEGDSAKLYLYLDGKDPVITEDTTNKDTTNDSPLYLGMRGDSSSYFTGGIGRLLIFKKALDEKEIRYWMRQNTSILPQDNPVWLEEKIGLVRDWRCNEGYGTIAFDHAKSNNGILGGSNGLEARPEWVASTIPTFVEFVKGATSHKSEESIQMQQNLARFVE